MAYRKTPQQVIANNRVTHEIVMGRIVRPSKCQYCGKSSKPDCLGRPTIQAHHHKGYDRPLDVVFICVKCHRKETPLVVGEAHVTSKLTPSDVSEIKKEIRAGIKSGRAIACSFGVSHSLIYDIRDGIQWRHIP